LNFLSEPIGRFFEFLHSGISTFIQNPNISYGITIILITAIIRLVVLPLNIKQMKSTLKMSEIQPQMKKLQDKYKNDPQKSQQEVMKLYKENGVNPLGGCLPLLIQMPILFALFYVFNNLTFMSGTMTQPAGFMWLKSLAKPDPYYILPVLSTVTTFLSSKLMQPAGDSAQAKQTSTMNIVMSLFMGFWSIKFKSALVIYWITNNLFQIAQAVVMKNSRKRKEANA
jgi:YidC/Oxa1 family membrane protein insertase